MDRDTRSDGTRPTGRQGPVRGVVDRSIGMYVFRRLTGRDADAADPSSLPQLLDPDEIAYRIGAAAERPRPMPVYVVPSGQPVVSPLVVATPRVSPAQPARRPPAAAPDAVRRRLLRDSGIALAGFAAVAFLALTVLPPAQGGVLGATGRPADQEVAAPSPTVSPRPS